MIIGMPRGGTSFVAGTLTENGFYNRDVGQRGSYECPLPVNHCPTMFSLPNKRISKEDIQVFESWIEEYKNEAAERGTDVAVQKWPGCPIWSPELFQSGSVEPILVSRDAEACGASIDRFFNCERQLVKWPNMFAMLGQNEISRLNKDMGWPIWEFSSEPDLKELESIVGVPLPVNIFQKDRVHF